MKKNLLWKTIVIVAVLLVFLAGIIGRPKNFSKQAILESIGKQIHLGLDLKGGTHLILQVMVDDAVNANSNEALERLKDDLRAGNIGYTEIAKPDPVKAPDNIVIRGVAPDRIGDLRGIISDRLTEYNMTSGAENSFSLSMKPEALADLKKRAVAQAIQKIRERVDSLGVSEPVIQEHGLGDHQILVQLPGVDDPARVKEIMQSTAMLEIRLVLGGPYLSEQEAYAGGMKTDAVLLRGRSDENGEAQYWWVARASAIAGNDLKSANVGTGSNGRPAVLFNLTRDGGTRFRSFTAAHLKESLAVVLDNSVKSVATINDEIGDRGEISGRFTDQQASDLALVLNSGALPASIRYIEERTVGPSLGMDSIRQGVRAALVGLVAVMIFMLIYYRGAGINANLSLLLNLIILLGFMSYFGAVLTLPGIAGVILTVGMGVDSNVLIFERIREELRNGKTPASAVEQGFSHAWLTIIDTHVTTIVSAIILFVFGTGPVRGFAVTLSFGLAANLFTAVFVSRAIFDAILNRHQRGEALSI